MVSFSVITNPFSSLSVFLINNLNLNNNRSSMVLKLNALPRLTHFSFNGIVEAKSGLCLEMKIAYRLSKNVQCMQNSAFSICKWHLIFEHVNIATYSPIFGHIFRRRIPRQVLRSFFNDVDNLSWRAEMGVYTFNAGSGI